MIPEKRRERILARVQEDEVCSIKDLVDELEVSRVTIMRDLNLLENSGLVSKIHGGVKAKKSDGGYSEARFKVRFRHNNRKKLQIAKKAVAFVKDHSTIFIDSSTTGHIFSAELFKNRYIELNIVTNSPTIITQASILPNIKIISTGGELNSSFSMFGGTWVIDFLDKINIDSAFISTAGISKDLYITSSNMDLSNILKKVIEKSDGINLLADSSKIFKREMLNVSSMEGFSRIITDDGISDDCFEALKNAGLEVIC